MWKRCPIPFCRFVWHNNAFPRVVRNIFFGSFVARSASHRCPTQCSTQSQCRRVEVRPPNIVSTSHFIEISESKEVDNALGDKRKPNKINKKGRVRKEESAPALVALPFFWVASIDEVYATSYKRPGLFGDVPSLCYHRHLSRARTIPTATIKTLFRCPRRNPLKATVNFFRVVQWESCFLYNNRKPHVFPL